ncbi:hypothetical protein ACFVS2_21250 [Brevibacillus sp. NPDC058079]|uniref:hypothetical protein n=1 Tax=Brevibacillus sp. NPDC058079 TaxID=3346330 RepID=UPI0036E97D7E
MVDSEKFSNKLYHAKINEWRQTVAKPYIESLPIERTAITFFNVNPNLIDKRNRGTIGETRYTRESKEIRTPLVVIYADEGKLETITYWIETAMELPKNEGYIEFQTVPKDLGHGVNAGIYNARVYLPNIVVYKPEYQTIF